MMGTKRTLVINAGEHDRCDCPVSIECPDGVPDGALWLRSSERGVALPAERIGDRLFFVVRSLERGTSLTLELSAGESVDGGVRLTERRDALDVSIDGKPFTSYHFGPDEVRPYLYPLLGPSGLAMTRHYPMRRDVPGESTDHPHHRSLYVAFGEVNGVDVWAEPPHPNTGRIVHRAWESVSDGPVVADLRERLQWVDAKDFPLLDERRRVTVYATSAVRLLDIEIVLSPARGAVLFGDTKEGGPLALRVNSAIEGRRGGLIENAYGGRREAETWGKRAPWVDYSGSIEGTMAGVAIMDHPTSFRHPTYWHVRDYGLFAANPFGISTFTNDPSQRGDVVLPPGQSLTFRYRVCLHLGDSVAGRVAEHYLDFAHPPTAAWE
jgi:hypothetical protein